jgi:hypothetical protein
MPLVTPIPTATPVMTNRSLSALRRGRSAERGTGTAEDISSACVLLNSRPRTSLVLRVENGAAGAATGRSVIAATRPPPRRGLVVDGAGIESTGSVDSTPLEVSQSASMSVVRGLCAAMCPTRSLLVDPETARRSLPGCCIGADGMGTDSTGSVDSVPLGVSQSASMSEVRGLCTAACPQRIRPRREGVMAPAYGRSEPALRFVEIVTIIHRL